MDVTVKEFLKSVREYLVNFLNTKGEFPRICHATQAGFREVSRQLESEETAEELLKHFDKGFKRQLRSNGEDGRFLADQLTIAEVMSWQAALSTWGKGRSQTEILDLFWNAGVDWGSIQELLDGRMDGNQKELKLRCTGCVVHGAWAVQVRREALEIIRWLSSESR